MNGFRFSGAVLFHKHPCGRHRKVDSDGLIHIAAPEGLEFDAGHQEMADGVASRSFDSLR